MSPLPPVSLGGDHSKVTQVSFTVEMGFSGADGGPKEKIISVNMGSVFLLCSRLVRFKVSLFV